MAVSIHLIRTGRSFSLPGELVSPTTSLISTALFMDMQRALSPLAGLHYILGKEEDGSTARVLRILVYVIGSCDADIIQRATGKMQIFMGRPSFDKVVAQEVENRVGAMGVLCCGNEGFRDDVRGVCRKAQSATSIDFFEESFTW
ncbi:hypothetical protein BDW59DRAFT_159948 [Aspergillus cavernicola]|uniref:Ferric reductase NAD binding domain-containing protein n=1 Tax=Aspergillus cavernicola TaxID=176166 RepID=A0ABR4IJP9_9EURO